MFTVLPPHKLSLEYTTWLVVKKEASKRGEAPLSKIPPSPLKERGIKGVR